MAVQHHHEEKGRGRAVYDHGPPVPPNQKVLVDHTADQSMDHEHVYIVPNHVHRHVGRRRYLTLLAFVFLLLVTTWQVWRVENRSNRNDRTIAAAQAQFVEQSEANCRLRTAQLRQAAASSALGRKFFLDMAKTLRADGDPRTAKLIVRTIKGIPPVRPPAQVNCDYPGLKAAE